MFKSENCCFIHLAKSMGRGVLWSKGWGGAIIQDFRAHHLQVGQTFLGTPFYVPLVGTLDIPKLPCFFTYLSQSLATSVKPWTSMANVSHQDFPGCR